MSEPAPNTVTEVRLRRAPRLWVFLLIGSIVGAVVTLIVTSLAPADPAIGFAATYGYFCLFGVPAGFVLGALVGLLLDRRSTRRATLVRAERESTERESTERESAEGEHSDPADREPQP